MARLVTGFCVTVSLAIWLHVTSRECGAQAKPLHSGGLELDYANLTAFLVKQALGSGRVEGSNPCDMSWVQCRYVADRNGQQRIRKLSISGAGLNGSIGADTLANLEALEYLNLSRNWLRGSIPEDIWGLRNLRTLDVSSNRLSGQLPDSLGRARSLRRLDVSGNLLRGPLPPRIERLGRLQFLNVGGNPLGGAIPAQLFNCTSLRSLLLSHAELSGSIAAQVGKLSNLTSLDLSSNNLSGGIPVELGGLSQLQHLDLSRNSLGGGIPGQLGGLTMLTSLDVSHNNLSGPIPAEWQSKFNQSCFDGNLHLCYQGQGCGQAGGPDNSSGAPAAAAAASSGLTVAVVTGIVAGGVMGLLLLAAACCLARVAARKAGKGCDPGLREGSVGMREPSCIETQASAHAAPYPSPWMAAVRDPDSVPVVLFEKPLLRVTLADVFASTNCLSKEHQLSDGFYGPMYRGSLPPNGLLVAVRVVTHNRMGSSRFSCTQTAAQLESLGRVKHANIVPLLGYCLAGKDKERCLLMHQLLTNGDVHTHLHDLPEGLANTEDWSRDTWEQVEAEACGDGGGGLGWEARHRIALGLARALSFLHHACSPHIVHTNVKASNVLLDADHEPYLADCGLSTLVGGHDAGGAAIAVAVAVAAAAGGYLPPEYYQHHTTAGVKAVSPRGDVYSFGVVLLELVTGKRPVGHSSFDSCGGTLVGWVRSLIRVNHGYKALDWKLTSKGPLPEMLEALRIGYLCTAESPFKRPTMRQVVLLLKDLQ